MERLPLPVERVIDTELADRNASERDDTRVIGKTLDGGFHRLGFIQDEELVEQASVLIEEGIISDKPIEFARYNLVPNLLRLAFGFEFRLDGILSGVHGFRG